MQLAWSVDWAQRDIMAKELLPIVLSCAVWGPLMTGSNVEFKCDNSGVVDSINKSSSKELIVMHLLQCLWFFSVSTSQPAISRVYPTLRLISCQETDWRSSSPCFHCPRNYPNVTIKIARSRTGLHPPFYAISSTPSTSFKHPQTPRILT